MDTPSGTVTVWQSGRLAPRAAPSRFEIGREHRLASALLVLSALVLTAFVAVLEKDVHGGAMAHQAQRSRAVAEAQCEADQAVESRGRCIVLLNGDVAALDSAPSAPSAPLAFAPDDTAHAAAYEQENLARATTLSLLAKR